MSSEIWKSIVGYPGYEVNSFGQVRSLTRSWQQRSRHGTYYQYRKQGRILRPGRASNGYPTVALGRKNTRTLHSLVATAFLGPCRVGFETRHKDGNRMNSQVSNLCYGTRRDNILDAVAHGTWMSPARMAHCKRLRSYRRGA